MKFLRAALLCAASTLCAWNASAQSVDLNIQEYLKIHYSDLGLSQNEMDNWKEEADIPHRFNGTPTIYLQQVINGLEVLNGTAVVVLGPDDEVLHFGRGLINSEELVTDHLAKGANHLEAINALARYLSIEGSVGIIIEENSDFIEMDKGTLASQNIRVSKAYWATEDHLELVWNVELSPKNGNDSRVAAIDAETGLLLNIGNKVVHCSFDANPYHAHSDCPTIQKHLNYSYAQGSSAQGSTNSTASGPQYHVFPSPIESPKHG